MPCRKAREEKARRAEKKARKAGTGNTARIPDGPPAKGGVPMRMPGDLGGLIAFHALLRGVRRRPM
jgi:hypothetical protein